MGVGSGRGYALGPRDIVGCRAVVDGRLGIWGPVHSRGRGRGKLDGVAVVSVSVMSLVGPSRSSAAGTCTGYGGTSVLARAQPETAKLPTSFIPKHSSESFSLRLFTTQLRLGHGNSWSIHSHSFFFFEQCLSTPCNGIPSKQTQRLHAKSHSTSTGSARSFPSFFVACEQDPTGDPS